MHRGRNVKIVATLGPASSTPDRIRALVEAGVDVFRLNFSHGSHDDHLGRIQAVRALERELQQPIGLLADLQGPKLRVGKFADGAVDLLPGTPSIVPTTSSSAAGFAHDAWFESVSPMTGSISPVDGMAR